MAPCRAPREHGARTPKRAFWRVPAWLARHAPRGSLPLPCLRHRQSVGWRPTGRRGSMAPLHPSGHFGVRQPGWRATHRVAACRCPASVIGSRSAGALPGAAGAWLPHTQAGILACASQAGASASRSPFERKWRPAGRRGSTAPALQSGHFGVCQPGWRATRERGSCVGERRHKPGASLPYCAPWRPTGRRGSTAPARQSVFGVRQPGWRATRERGSCVGERRHKPGASLLYCAPWRPAGRRGSTAPALQSGHFGVCQPGWRATRERGSLPLPCLRHRQSVGWRPAGRRGSMAPALQSVFGVRQPGWRATHRVAACRCPASVIGSRSAGALPGAAGAWRPHPPNSVPAASRVIRRATRRW